MDDNVTKLPTPPKHFELGKHMAKLTIFEPENAVVILRPRYQKSMQEMLNLIKGIERWRNDNKVKTRVLIVPFDYDVFVAEADGAVEGEDGEQEGEQQI